MNLDLVLDKMEKSRADADRTIACLALLDRLRHDRCARSRATMGLQIIKDSYTEEEFAFFERKLAASVRALRSVLVRPSFGVGPPSIGAELELDLVDVRGRPLGVNAAVLADAADDRLTLEADRWNLEINARPQWLAGRPFAAMEADLQDALGVARRASARHGASVLTIGILPTLEETDLTASALTDANRYRALAAGLTRLRREPIAIMIEGEDALHITAHDVAFEGATTSFQVHLRVDPSDFARSYNAAQIATAPLLAAATNSPLFLGRRLWEETRIALFRAAADDRASAAVDDWRPARVSFGHGWVRHSAIELFDESWAMHAPLLAACGKEDPEDVARRGGVPDLAELRLHQGTVWRWNRAIYDSSAGGHLRIEMRALPAGPTVADMVANAAFAIGVVRGLSADADRWTTLLTFGQARRNFYEAARRGLDAELLWPSDEPPSPRPISARDVALSLIPIARRGLLASGVLADDVDPWLDIIAARVSARTTGARWQRRFYDRLRAGGATTEDSARELLGRYRALSESEVPVHAWPDT